MQVHTLTHVPLFLNYPDNLDVYRRVTLRAGYASGWKRERALNALTSTPIGWASCAIACIIP